MRQFGEQARRGSVFDLMPSLTPTSVLIRAMLRTYAHDNGNQYQPVPRAAAVIHDFKTAAFDRSATPPN
jgi:hypothetical protein